MTMPAFVKGFFFLAFFLWECHGLQWASGPADGQVMHVCANGSISLDWNVHTSSSPREIIESIQWFHVGTSQTLIAMQARRHFLPSPAFAARVTKEGTAGLRLTQLQTGDSGNYSVEVFARTSQTGQVQTLTRSVYVHVAEGLQTTTGNLHVSQDPVAELDNTTGQYHVVLRCGTFTYPTTPPFTATWTTPSGAVLTSTRFERNNFVFLVPNPVEGGTYRCRVNSPTACVGGGSSAGDFTVDRVEARLAVLEARNNALETWKEQMSHRTSTHVSFNVANPSPSTYSSSGRIVKWSAVNLNVGSGYDSGSGKFTAPVSGYYFLTVATRSYSADSADSDIKAQTTGSSSATVCRIDSSVGNDAAACSGVAHLRQGAQAWVQTYDGSASYTNNVANSFSGFLIHADP